MTKLFLSRWLPLLLSMALIFAFSMRNPYLDLPAAVNQPIQSAGESIGQALIGHAIDEQELLGQPGHVLEFALLGATAARALIWKRKPTIGFFLLTFAACGLYALSDEIHQTFVPGRAFEIRDLVLDGAGIVMGLCLYWLVRRLGCSARKWEWPGISAKK
jgi:VanZ family protein